MLTYEQIKQILNDDCKYVKSLYAEERILGIFVYGKANFIGVNNIQEINTQAIYIPSFQDMCINIQPIYATLQHNNHKIKVTDFRKCIQATYQKNNELQALFTQYITINPRYQQIYDKGMKNKRRAIIDTNWKTKVAQYANWGIKHRDQPYEVLYAYHMVNMLRNHVEANTLEFNTTEKILLNSPQTYGQNKEDIIYQLCNIYDEYKNFQVLQIPQDLKQGMIKIISMNTINNINNTVINNLTNTEYKALQAILDTTEGDGFINLSQAIKKYGISRNTFLNVMNKLKQSGAATIEGRGPKGTYVKITNYDAIGVYQK